MAAIVVTSELPEICAKVVYIAKLLLRVVG